MTEQLIRDLFIPVDDLISGIGKGIMEAQGILDITADEMQKEIDKLDTTGFGVQATRFTIPESEVKMKTILSKTNSGKTVISTLNASVQNKFSIPPEFLGELRIKIKAIPNDIEKTTS